MTQIISAVFIVGGTGLVFGCILAFASFIFKVDEDTRIELILTELPGANCGACGFAGCAAYAAAVVSGQAGMSACTVGKQPTAEKIAAIMGSTPEAATAMTAEVLCGGTCTLAKNKYDYSGISDCIAANKLSGGAKSCPFGCLGLGSCVRVCQFGAIVIQDGIAVIDKDKCVACGKCVVTCPKHIITLMPAKQEYVVKCISTDSAATVNQYCKTGCIACKICEKNCPSSAIMVVDNVAVIDYANCTNCGICAEKCPKKIIYKKEKGEIG